MAWPTYISHILGSDRSSRNAILRLVSIKFLIFWAQIIIEHLKGLLTYFLAQWEPKIFRLVKRRVLDFVLFKWLLEVHNT